MKKKKKHPEITLNSHKMLNFLNFEKSGSYNINSCSCIMFISYNNQTLLWTSTLQTKQPVHTINCRIGYLGLPAMQPL